MRDTAGVLAQRLISRDGWPRGDLAREPGLERLLRGDLAGSFEASDQCCGVVAGGVGEVLEVEGRLDGWVGAGEVEAAARTWTGDVGCHAEGVDGGVVAEAGGVEAEGDLIAVHHYVCWVRGGALEEETCVAVHGGLVGWYGAVEFPDDDGFGVVEKVSSHARDVGDKRNGERGEVRGWANARVKEETWGVDCTGAEDCFLFVAKSEGGAGLET